MNIQPKKWGKEIILHNDKDYCIKFLRFNAGAKFSMHFHMLKTETWYVNKGEFTLKYINTKNADEQIQILTKGMIVNIEKGDPHQLIAITDGEIFEVSTQHFDDDSYRIEKGDNQLNA